MSSTEMEKYSQGYVFSQQAELDSLENPENYLEEVKDARRIQQQSIEYNQRIASEPLSSNSREAWARRNQAKKAVKEAKKATKQINKMETEVKEQVTARRTYLEAQKAQERQVYVEAAKKKEQEMKFLVEKEKWISQHKIGDIPEGIEKGFLSEGSMSWYNRLKALEAPYANRRADLPSHERHKLEFLYKGGTEKEWGDIRERERVNRQLSQKQSASIKEAAAIVESGGTLDSQRGSPLAPGSLMGSDLRATSTDPKIAAANQAQQAYVAQLRAGGIGLAQALLKPQTDQSYLVKEKTGVTNDFKEVTKDQTSINLEKFLTERGYDISKPETIPDSIFKAPVKYVRARAQTKEPTMGDLTTKIPDSPQITKAELDQRRAIQEKFAIPESPPEIVITKTETKTKPSTVQITLHQTASQQQIFAQEDSKLPPGFESGEAVPLINYDKGLAGGFFGHTAELYTSVSNLFRPEDQQRYTPPSLESTFFDETISGAKHLVGWRDEEGNLPPLKTGKTQELILNKDVGWLVGSVGATIAIGAATFGAQRVYPWIKGLITGGKYDKEVASLINQFYKPGEKVGVEKLPEGKYFITAGTANKPAEIPAIIVQPGKRGFVKTFTEYQPSQLPPTSLTISGGTKGFGFEKMQDVAPWLTYVPGTKYNIQMMSSPSITNFVKPVGQTTKFSWQETKKFPKTVLTAATSSDAQMSRGIIAETKAVKIKPTETKPFETFVHSPSGSTVPRIYSPTTGKFKFPGSGKEAPPPSGKPSLVEPTKTTAPNTEKVKEIVKEMTEAEKKAFANMEIKTGTTSAVLGTATTSTTKAQGITAPQGTTDATVFSAPKTTTLTGTQTTTITTDKAIPLSTPLKMITPTIQKDKASISLKDIAKEIASVKEEQKLESATIPLTSTAIKQQLDPQQETVTTTGTRIRLVPAITTWKVKTKTKLALVPALKQTTITPPDPPNKTRDIPTPRLTYNPLIRQEKEKKKVTKKKRGFKGNVPETTIIGVWKEDKEITYGKKKIGKLVSRDWKLIKGGKGSLINVKTPKKSKRKRKSSTENVLGIKQPKKLFKGQRGLTTKQKKSKVVSF